MSNPIDGKEWGPLPEPDSRSVMHVDVMIPLARGQTPTHLTERSLLRQEGVILHVHRMEGPSPRPGENRIQTICRSRNQIKQVGYCGYALFLDYDVILPESNHAVALMAEHLWRESGRGAVALQYSPYWLGCEPHHYRGHIGAGLVLYRRTVLDQITFREADGLCECILARGDVEALGKWFGYHPLANHPLMMGGHTADFRGDALTLEEQLALDKITEERDQALRDGEWDQPASEAAETEGDEDDGQEASHSLEE